MSDGFGMDKHVDTTSGSAKGRRRWGVWACLAVAVVVGTAATSAWWLHARSAQLAEERPLRVSLRLPTRVLGALDEPLAEGRRELRNVKLLVQYLVIETEGQESTPRSADELVFDWPACKGKHEQVSFSCAGVTVENDMAVNELCVAKSPGQERPYVHVELESSYRLEAAQGSSENGKAEISGNIAGCRDLWTFGWPLDEAGEKERRLRAVVFMTCASDQDPLKEVTLAEFMEQKRQAIRSLIDSQREIWGKVLE